MTENKNFINCLISEFSIINNAIFIEDMVFSGIYFLIDKNKIVYVGQTKHGFFRIFEHVKNKKFEKISFFYCNNELLNYYENFYIMKYKPKYNKTIPKNGYFVNAKNTNKILFSNGRRIKLQQLKNIIEKQNIKKYYFNGELFIKKKDIKNILNYLKGE